MGAAYHRYCSRLGLRSPCRHLLQYRCIDMLNKTCVYLIGCTSNKYQIKQRFDAISYIAWLFKLQQKLTKQDLNYMYN